MYLLYFYSIIIDTRKYSQFRWVEFCLKCLLHLFNIPWWRLTLQPVTHLCFSCWLQITLH